MPKMKSHRGAAKRFKRTGSGKLKRHHAYMNHQSDVKTKKRKRHLAKSSVVSNSDHKRIKDLVYNLK